MRLSEIKTFFAACSMLAFSLPIHAAKDMKGGRDHPDIPRIDGTAIFGYQYADYDEAVYLFTDKNSKIQAVKAAGKRTQILYIAPRSITKPTIFQNYDVALKELGKIEPIYRCSNSCPNDLTDGLIWKKGRRIPNKIPRDAGYLYVKGNAPSFTDQGYAYATVTSDKARYHISVFTALFTGQWIPELANYRSIHVDVLEEANFTPTLVEVKPEEITEGLSKSGHIALYGIYFDFDKVTLKEASTPALEAITTALNNNPLLNIYVVGHTDNQGAYQYNLDLSKRRAASVVEALAGKHGVSPDRLVPLGIGPAAPVASNSTVEGQALNRRVELVEK